MLMFLSQVRWFESRVRRATAMVQCLMKHVCITGYYRRVSGRRNTVDRNRYRSRQPCFEKPLDLLELTPKKNHAPFCSPPHQKVVPSFRIQTIRESKPFGNVNYPRGGAKRKSFRKNNTIYEQTLAMYDRSDLSYSRIHAIQAENLMYCTLKFFDTSENHTLRHCPY